MEGKTKQNEQRWYQDINMEGKNKQNEQQWYQDINIPMNSPFSRERRGQKEA